MILVSGWDMSMSCWFILSIKDLGMVMHMTVVINLVIIEGWMYMVFGYV